MHFPFLVADPRSGLQFRPTDTTLAELSLAPSPGQTSAVWAPGRKMLEAPDPVWAQSLEHAPVETIAAVTRALEDLVLATPDLRIPPIGSNGGSRAQRHLTALVRLWQAMGEALPEGLAVVRHVLELPEGRCLDAMPVVEGSLALGAPAAFQALYARLLAEFGSVPAPPKMRASAPGSRLHALQAGLLCPALETGPEDPSLAFYGLRDAHAAADFASARARALIENGVLPKDIAVMAAGDPGPLARAFKAQGVAISGLPSGLPSRDVIGETALQLMLAKRPPTPRMVLASLALSPLMPWASQTGRDLSERLMDGDFRGGVLAANPEHASLWTDIRASAGSLAQLRLLLDRICARLAEGDQVRARMAIPQNDAAHHAAPETPLDWEALLRGIETGGPNTPDPDRNLEGVSLWPAQETPWRSCQHLIVVDFTDGCYPARPRANPLFLDSEIAEIRAQTGLSLTGRSEGLAHGLSLFDAQLQAVAQSVAFLTPRRDLAGGRLHPAAGLSLVARVIAPQGDAGRLIQDLAHIPATDLPVTSHYLPALAPPLNAPETLPEALTFRGLDLNGLRKREDGSIAPQSPSRLETLLVSPLAWLLGEIGAGDMTWGADGLDAMTLGNIAHEVFEHLFPVGDAIPDPETLTQAFPPLYERAIQRHADFLREATWEMEREALARDILASALRWHAHLTALQAKILGNEIWLAGEAHGINLHGKADTVLELPDGALLIVDHKKSGTRNRRPRMEAAWDLQAGLYRDMLTRPERREGDAMGPLLGRKVAIAYHLMNDGGLLASGLAAPDAAPGFRDMGEDVTSAAVAKLKERIKELGGGRLVLNTSDDIKTFEKEAGIKAYALKDGSTLVTAFIRPVGEEEEEE